MEEKSNCNYKQREYEINGTTYIVKSCNVADKQKRILEIIGRLIKKELEQTI